MNPRRMTMLALVFLSSSCAGSGDWRLPSLDCLRRGVHPTESATLSDGSKVDTWLTDWNDKDGMHTCRKTFTVDWQGKVVHESLFDCTPGPDHNIGTELTQNPKTRTAIS